METVTSKKGQVVIPKPLRLKYHIESGTRIEWIDTGSAIKMVPVPKDPIGFLKGCAQDEDLVETLLKNRIKDKELEH